MSNNTAKRTRPAQSQANRQPAVAQASERKPVPELPGSIDQITDAVAEMLTKGASDYSINHLLYSAIAHINRRRYEQGIGIEDEKTIGEGFDRELKWHFQQWKTDVIAMWRENRRQSVPAVEPQSITERIRANVRRSLEGRFGSFLGTAEPEEIRLMESILCSWESGLVRGVDGVDEIALGQAFAYELEALETYIRVPFELRGKVQKYIDALKAIKLAEGRAA